jgi:hypothetical protein
MIHVHKHPYRTIMPAAAACILFLWPATAALPAIVVADDPLDSPETCSGTVTGIGDADLGFIAGVGWEQRTNEARIEYDFGASGIDSGSIDLDVTNFDPTAQMVGISGEDDYHDLLTFYEGPSREHHGCYDSAESCMEIQVVGLDPSDINRDNRVKYMITTWTTGCAGPPSHCDGMYTVPDSGIAWDLAETYHFRLEWGLDHAGMVVTESSSGASHSVEYDLYWAPEAPERTLNFRYFFIGRDDGVYGKPIVGPIWSNLVVTSFDDEPYCGDGECRAGEEDCAACPQDCGECGEADADEPVPETADGTSSDEIDEAEAPADAARDPDVTDVEDDVEQDGTATGGCSCSLFAQACASAGSGRPGPMPVGCS